MRTAVLLVLVLAAVAVAAPVPPPTAREAAQLVEKLGSQDFVEREAATKRLDELGVLALDELRGACKSEDPEVAERAKDLVRKIERRASSDRALAPAVVELDAKDTPVDDVLAALSKQSGYEVVLGGLKADELAAKKVTVATGKVPFWTAVLKVCDAAELQLSGVSGFVAPGSVPYYGRANQIRGILEDAKTRVAAEPEKAVVLEGRAGGKKRPASVHGAVLVEAFDLPRGASSPQVSAAVLQFWPEPRVAWQSVVSHRTTKATDPEGRKITPDVTPPPAPPPPIRPGRGPLVREVEGGLAVVPGFKPNIRQAVVKFKPGEERATVARELTGSVVGLVRSAVEPLATVPLDADKAVTVTGQAGVELTASVRAGADGKQVAKVTLSFPPAAVDPARPGEELTGVKPPAAGGNRTVLGVRVTDAAGAPFDLALAEQASDFDPTGRRIVVKLTLTLGAAKDGPTVPAKVAFWGTTPRPVEVAFALKDVPLR